MNYRTEKGDILDAVCTRRYGLNAFDLTQVYAANVALTRHGAVLPGGLVIALPEAARITPEPELIRLVD